jgi:hypothetical protein
VGWARVTVHKVELVGCCCIYTIAWVGTIYVLRNIPLDSTNSSPVKLFWMLWSLVRENGVIKNCDATDAHVYLHSGREYHGMYNCVCNILLCLLPTM